VGARPGTPVGDKLLPGHLAVDRIDLEPQAVCGLSGGEQYQPGARTGLRPASGPGTRSLSLQPLQDQSGHPLREPVHGSVEIRSPTRQRACLTGAEPSRPAGRFVEVFLFSHTQGDSPLRVLGGGTPTKASDEDQPVNNSGPISVGEGPNFAPAVNCPHSLVKANTT